MSLDTNEEKVELDYIDGFTEKNESINLSNKTILDISRFDGAVIGYVKNFKIEDGIDEIIEVFENDLQTAKEVSIYMCIPENYNFLQSDILVSIEKMIKPNCNINFILFANDKNITSTSLKIKIYNKAKNILLKEIHDLPN